MRKSMKGQKGNAVIGAILGAVLFSVVITQWAGIQKGEAERAASELQAQRLAEVVNAVVRYQGNGGDTTAVPPVLGPLEQWNVAGQPFRDGAVHEGLDWLKSNDDCGGASSSPFPNLNCNTVDRPFLGGDTVYRFTVTNNGMQINTRVEIVQATDPTLGFLADDGQPDSFLASEVSAFAERKAAGSAMGAANVLFDTDAANARIFSDVGINAALTPYLTRTGSVTATGTQRYEDGAGIEGAEFVAAEIFADYDRATGTVSATRFIDMDGNSHLENLTVENLESPVATIDNLTTEDLQATRADIETALINDAQIEYIDQIDGGVQNQFAGQINVNNGGGSVLIGDGSVNLTGGVVNSNNPDYYLDLDENGVTRLNDIILTQLGNRRISDVMPNLSLKGVRLVQPNNILPMPSCPPNGSPRLILTPKHWTTIFLDSGQIRVNNNINYFDAEITGNNWRILIKTHDVSSPSLALIDDPVGLALAEVYCYYP